MQDRYATLLLLHGTVKVRKMRGGKANPIFSQRAEPSLLAESLKHTALTFLITSCKLF